MAVLKEYIVRVKWKQDQSSKSSVLKDIQKSFKDLTKDIEAATKAAKKFFDTYHKGAGASGFKRPTSGGGTSGSPGEIVPMGPAAIGPHLYRYFNQGRGMRGMSYGGSMGFGPPKALTGPSSMGAAEGEEAGGAMAGGALFGPASAAALVLGVVAIEKGVKKLIKVMEEFGQRMIQNQAQNALGGWGGLSTFMQHLQGLTGINLSGFGGLNQLSFAAHTGRNPRAIQRLQSLYQQELMSGGAHSAQLAQFILSHGMQGDLTGRKAMREFLTHGGGNKDLVQELGVFGFTPEQAMAIARNRGPLLSSMANATRIPQKQLDEASQAWIRAASSFSNLETTVEKNLIPSFIQLANGASAAANFLIKLSQQHHVQGTIDKINKTGSVGGSVALTAEDYLVEGLGYLKGKADYYLGIKPTGPGPNGNTINSTHSNSHTSSMHFQQTNNSVL